MNFAEYVEAVSGRKLANYQKEMLEKYEKFPRGAVVLMTPRGPIIVDLKKKERKHAHKGYSIKRIMIDETVRENKEG